MSTAFRSAGVPSDGVLRQTNLQPGAARTPTLNVGDELSVRLFEGVDIELSLKRQNESPLGGRSFLAEVAGYDGVKNAVVHETAEGLQIDVQDYKNGRVYTVFSGTDGVVVKEIDPNAGRTQPSNPLEPLLTESLQEAPMRMRLSAAQQSSSCVDILMAFDRNAAMWADAQGGGITNFATVTVQKMNLALGNTGLDEKFRFRLVGVMAVPSETDDLNEALNAVTYGSEGWSSVKAMRETVGADIVTTLIDTGSAFGMTGLSWGLRTTNIAGFSGYGYNTCSIRAAAQSHVVTHECGHNMGAGHSDVQADGPGPQLYEYSAGYYFKVGSTSYHTIMAYNSDGITETLYQPVPFFSSPDYAYEGVPVGDSKHDNTKTIEQTFGEVSNWRMTVVPESYDVWFSPAAGTPFEETVSVELMAGKDGLEIRYTLDGSEPTLSSALYSKKIVLRDTTTIKAAAVYGGRIGQVFAATYYKANLGVALDAPQHDWTTSSDCPWRIQSTNTVEGALALGTAVPPKQSSWVKTTLSGPVTIDFAYMLEGYPNFQVLCDGASLFSFDNSSSYGKHSQYVRETCDVPEGLHEVSFVLTSGSAGSTHGWLDDIRFYTTSRPTFYPETTQKGSMAHTFIGETIVEIRHPLEDVQIYYTIDGSDPEGEQAIHYEGPFLVSETTKIRAIAVAVGGERSGIAEGVYVERHVPRSGEWTTNSDGAMAVARKNGRLIAVLSANYLGCYYSQLLEPVVSDEKFTAWAAANGIYLVSADTGRYLDADSAMDYVWMLYGQTSLSSQLGGGLYYPTFVLASPKMPFSCVGAFVARTGRSDLNGIAYEGTVDSLTRIIASALNSPVPEAPAMSGIADFTDSFPVSVSLSHANATGTIYYTLDGSAPTPDKGLRYENAISVVSNGTVLCAAVWPSDGGVSSPVVTHKFAGVGDFMGKEGVSWYNDPSLPWSRRSEGWLQGGKDLSLRTGRLSSTLKATVTGPGIFKFDYEMHSSSSTPLLTFNVDGVTVEKWKNGKTGSYVYNVASVGPVTFEWVYDYFAYDTHPSFYGAIGNVSWTHVPAQPKNVKAQFHDLYGTLVRWDAVEGATSYRVYVGASQDFSQATLLGERKLPLYWDVNFEIGRRYYWVQAINGMGDGPVSSALAYDNVHLKSYVVSFDAGDHGVWGCVAGSIKSVKLATGDPYSASDLHAMPGWRFAGWSEDLSSVTSNMTVRAIYEREEVAPISDDVVADWYVDAFNGRDTNNGKTPKTAFATIQKAITKSSNGQMVMVNDGVYPSINVSSKQLSIISVNGSWKTVIDGGKSNCCAYLNSSTRLEGFMLINGSAISGGGAYSGTLDECVLRNNVAFTQYTSGAAPQWGRGAGCAQSTLNRCVVVGNYSEDCGGGMYGGIAYNCLFVGNSAGSDAGAADGTDIYNCTMVGNSAGFRGGATWGADVYNSILWNNSAPTGADVSDTSCYFCRVGVIPRGGSDNITDDPMFVDAANGDYHLLPQSPCIDAGWDAYVSEKVDFDGNDRIHGLAVDMGIYEIQPTGKCEVNYDIGEHGTRIDDVPLSSIVFAGDRLDFPIVRANDGWRFVGWSPSLDSISVDTTFVAQYEAVALPTILTDVLPDAIEMTAYSTTLSAKDVQGDSRWTAFTEGYDTYTSRTTYEATGRAQGWTETYRSSHSYELPFEFEFFGKSYSTVSVNGNGTLSFGESEVAQSNSAWLEYMTNSVCICPLFDWYNSNVNNDIYIKATGDRVTFRWVRESVYTDLDEEFSATLHADGRICFSYGTSCASSHALCGLSAGDGRRYLDFSREGLGTKDILFYPVDVPSDMAIPSGLTLTADGKLQGTPVSSGTYNFKMGIVNDAGEFVCKMFQLAVTANANERPQIVGATPSSESVTLPTCREMAFSVFATDPELQPLTYRWYLDGALVQTESTGRYVCATNSLSPGNHVLTCDVTDGLWQDVVKQTWNLRVVEPLLVTPETNFEELAYMMRYDECILFAPGEYDMSSLEELFRYGSGGRLIAAEGPSKTILSGEVSYMRGRCVFDGFTLTCGGDFMGGEFVNCVFTGCQGLFFESCALTGCAIVGNKDLVVSYGTSVQSSTFTGNQWSYPTESTTFVNSIIWEEDTIAFGTEEYPMSEMGNVFNHCCLSVEMQDGEGNICADPMLFAPNVGDVRLRRGSPCLDAGCFGEGLTDSDIYGNLRVAGAAPDIGAAEGFVEGYSVSARIVGAGELDQTILVVPEGGTATFTALPGLRPFDHFEKDGVMLTTEPTLTLSNVRADCVVMAVFKTYHFYVDAQNGNDANDGLSRTKAKKTIQAAIDEALAGETVTVLEGRYQPIVCNNKKISIVSERGASETFIDASGTNVCCAMLSASYSGTNTLLRGFTLCNADLARIGGGMLCGGGVCYGTLEDCVITNCCVRHIDCEGAGAYNSVLRRCLIVDNKIIADDYARGGGTYQSDLYDCVLRGNVCVGRSSQGGGAYYGMLVNCTLCDNVATNGGGAYSGTLRNCIVWGNQGRSGYENVYSSTCQNSWTSGDPCFVDAEHGDYRLRSDSPCIDAGSNVYVSSDVDLDGNRRIANGVVDMGAYEYQTRPTVQATADDVRSTYDGASRKPVVRVSDPAKGATVTYSLDGKSWTVNLPSFVDAGAYEVYYRVEADGYEPASGSVALTILPRQLTLTSRSKSKEHDGLPLTLSATDIDATGYVDGECLSYRDFASIVEVGEVSASFGCADSATAKVSNYAIDCKFGMLSITPSADLLGQAVDCEGLKFKTGGAAGWFIQSSVVRVGDTALRSGAISDSQKTWLEATVSGSGTLTFWMKTSSERYKSTPIDFVRFNLDGGEYVRLGGETDWTQVSVPVSDAGLHVLRWEYLKDEGDSSGEDCAWLDAVTWTPETIVPTLADLDDIFGEESDVVKEIRDENRLAAFNDFLKGCAITSAAELSAAQKQYAYRSFRLSEIMVAPQLFEVKPKLEISEFKPSGGGFALTVSLTAGGEGITLAKDALKQKIRIGGSLDAIDIPLKDEDIITAPSADEALLTFVVKPLSGQQGFMRVKLD